MSYCSNNGDVYFLLVAGLLLIFGALGVIINSICSPDNNNNTYRWYHRCHGADDFVEGRMALRIVQILVGFIALILTITSSVLSCKATCCNSKKNSDNLMMSARYIRDLEKIAEDAVINKDIEDDYKVKEHATQGFTYQKM